VDLSRGCRQRARIRRRDRRSAHRREDASPDGRLYSDRSQIALRMLSQREAPTGEAAIRARIASAIAFASR